MRYLFIGAHCDDLELSCWATITKLKESGHEIKIIILSSSYDGISLIAEGGTSSIKTLDVIPDFYNFKCRHFGEQRQLILQAFIDIGDFDYIFTHSANSIHQDHKVVGEESIRAFKKSNLITYEHEWNLLQSESNYHVEVTEDQIANKIEAMGCYKSQQHRPYFDKQFTYSRALLAGSKIGVKYAEPFRIINYKG